MALTHTELRRLADLRLDLVAAARLWALDCLWLDGDLLATLPGELVLAGAERHYDGGLAQLALDSLLAPIFPPDHRDLTDATITAELASFPTSPADPATGDGPWYDRDRN